MTWLLCFALAAGAAVATPLASAIEPVTLPKPKPELKVFANEPKPAATNTPGWTADMTPADFLDSMGARIKARWRQLYRPPPPTPPTERTRAAFALGSLVADSFLALEATDSQQFRNTGQDQLAYCRVLGIGEKMSPRLMSQGKLSEMDEWAKLRQEVVDGHQQLVRVLHEMRDDDLAILVDLGVWLRMLEIVSNMVKEAPEAQAWALCIGAPGLVSDLNARFAQLTASPRADEHIMWLGEYLSYLQRYSEPDNEPDQAAAAKVGEKITSLMMKMTLK
jgi:hypothetical protein